MAGRAKYTEEDRAKVFVLLRTNDGNVKRTSREAGVPENTVRRLLDLRHSSHMWIIDEALAKMNSELPIDLPKVRARGKAA